MNELLHDFPNTVQRFTHAINEIVDLTHTTNSSIKVAITSCIAAMFVQVTYKFEWYAIQALHKLHIFCKTKHRQVRYHLYRGIMICAVILLVALSIIVILRIFIQTYLMGENVYATIQSCMLFCNN